MPKDLLLGSFPFAGLRVRMTHLNGYPFGGENFVLERNKSYDNQNKVFRDS